MAGKLNVMVLFGGQSEEHEVSLMSCASVVKNMDPEKYHVYYIGITKRGQWRLFEGQPEQIAAGDWERYSKRVVFPGDPSFGGFFAMEEPQKVYPVDVAFPIMHGPHAEDGTLQGLFEMANVPYVGSGVAASAVGMDKAMANALFAAHEIPHCDYLVFLSQEVVTEPEKVILRVSESFGYPCFVKPANMGSSVGVSKVRDDAELLRALREAARHDRKILVEEFIDGREIECSVLGNDSPIASVPGEIIPSNEFYDYQAKYVDGKSKLGIPARLEQCKRDEIMQLAIKAYRALDCSGMARVDMFLHKKTDQVLVSEVNTIPGFTSISMYPKLWEASGIGYAQLIDRLIELALERAREKAGV